MILVFLYPTLLQDLKKILGKVHRIVEILRNTSNSKLYLMIPLSFDEEIQKNKIQVGDE